MATVPIDLAPARSPFRRLRDLRDPKLAIGNPRLDALLLWGVPILSYISVTLCLDIAQAFPHAVADRLTHILVGVSVILTYAHLMAVFPRAYLNRDVFRSNSFKLTMAPVLLLLGLILSPTLLVIGAVVGFYWDVHHTAMQNFGLSRIYDMKAGNDPQELRATDLRLNWFLYVGPLLAGASFPFHIESLYQLRAAGLTGLARMPGVLEGRSDLVTTLAIAAWAAIILWAGFDYRRAIARGYRLPVHKAALLISTAGVSVLAWGFSSPIVALAAINIYHALQYFAIVWLKEGPRMTAFARVRPRIALDFFLGACLVGGIGYQFATQASLPWLLAPFVACSLLHFWFDGFVWSVRKRQV